MISFDPKEKVIEETKIKLQHRDWFSNLHNGVKVNESIYLCGGKHLHIFNLNTNKTKCWNEKGFEA